MRNTSFILTALLLLGVFASAQAKVSGPCDNCHTMHNSFDGQPMNWDASFAANLVLLLGDCVGCHTGQNIGTNTTPYVFDSSGPVYGATGTEAGSKTLAGGNFYWVAQGNDRVGHNVYGLTAQDTLLSSPPGGNGIFTSQLRCAGTMGCHGSYINPGDAEPIISMRKSHHLKDQSGWQDGSTLATSYRFLSGIQGLGDLKYEYEPTVNNHNKYYGIDRSAETETADGTISALCARCHGDYHDGAGNVVSGSTFGGGVWIRHPTNFDMSNALSSAEYAGYNGAGNPYSVISPVATSDATDTPYNRVLQTGEDAVVMCISCHRAHGSPNNGSLRWDYKSWPGGGYNGCAICHTSKD
jgi:hypothetical protein